MAEAGRATRGPIGTSRLGTFAAPIRGVPGRPRSLDGFWFYSCFTWLASHGTDSRCPCWPALFPNLGSRTIEPRLGWIPSPWWHPLLFTCFRTWATRSWTFAAGHLFHWIPCLWYRRNGRLMRACTGFVNHYAVIIIRHFSSQQSFACCKQPSGGYNCHLGGR